MGEILWIGSRFHGMGASKNRRERGGRGRVGTEAGPGRGHRSRRGTKRGCVRDARVKARRSRAETQERAGDIPG